MVAADKFRPHRQFVRRQSQRLACDRFSQSVELKQNISGLHGRDPKLRGTFPFTHSRFGRARCDRFVRKNPDPQFAFAFHVASQRHPCGFDLRIRDPSTLERLQTELAKIDSKIARSSPLPASPLGFPILHAFGHQWHKNQASTGSVGGGGGGAIARGASLGASSFLQIQHLTPIFP